MPAASGSIFPITKGTAASAANVEPRTRRMVVFKDVYYP
jgi:hypothetical protein